MKGIQLTFFNGYETHKNDAGDAHGFGGIQQPSIKTPSGKHTKSY